MWGLQWYDSRGEYGDRKEFKEIESQGVEDCPHI